MIRLLGTALLEPGLCRSLMQAGLGVMLQSTLLLGFGLLTGRALRRRGPALEALIYRVTLVGALLGGLLSLSLGGRFLPLWRVPLPPVPAAPAPVSPEGIGVTPPLPAPGTAALPGRTAWDQSLNLPGSPRHSFPGPDRRERRSGPVRRPASASPDRGRPWPGHGETGGVVMALAGAWAAGVLPLLFWLGLCQLHLRRLRREAAPIREGATAEMLGDLCRRLRVRPPALLLSPRESGPFLTGLRRPAILLPAAAQREFDPSMLRAVLAHELVHLARRDCAWNLLARLACALCWPQPLFWLLERRLRQASEEVCDQEVVRLQGDARAYARCLFTLSERLLPSSRERVLGVGVVPFRSALGRRIARILAGSPPQPLSRLNRAAVLLGAGAVLALLLLILPIGAIHPQAETRPLGLEASAGGEHAAPSRHSALAGVPELAKPVTLTATRIPLGELVARVAAGTGVPLAAAPEVADEPVDVVVKDLPARELLEQLADLLDYRWLRQVRSGESRFLIDQNAGGRQREEALREAMRARAWQRLGARIDGLARMAARPPAGIERLLAEEKRWVTHLFQLPYAERLAMNDPDRARQREFWMAESLASPVARCEAALVGRLTPPQWARLRQGQPLVFATHAQAGELPLPEAVARALHAARPPIDNGPPYDPGHEAEERERRQAMADAWAAATGYQVRIALDASRFQSDGELSLQAAAIPLHGAPSDRPAAFLSTSGTSFGVGVGPSYVDQWDPDDPAEKARAARRAALANDPVYGAKQPLRVDTRPLRPDEPYFTGAWGLGEMLPAVARTYGVSLISDAYTWDRTTSRFSSATPIALYDLLDRLAGDRHMWDHRGRLVRFRFRAWPFFRRQEVPMRLLRRWQALLDRDGALPLSEWLSAVTTLSDLQLDTLLHIGLFRDGPSAFATPYDPRYALRLYLSLSPGQQRALRQGEALPLARMTPAQQTLFLATLRDQAQMRHGILVPGTEPTVGPQAALSLTTDCRVWVFKRHGNWTGIHTEPVPSTPPAAAPRPPAAAPATVTRRTITTVTFHFRTSSGAEATVPLNVSSLRERDAQQGSLNT